MQVTSSETHPEKGFKINFLICVQSNPLISPLLVANLPQWLYPIGSLLALNYCKHTNTQLIIDAVNIGQQSWTFELLETYHNSQRFVAEKM